MRPTKWKICKCISIDMVETWWYWHQLGFRVKKWRPKFPTDFGLNQGLLFLFLKHESSCRVKPVGLDLHSIKIVAVFFIKSFSHDIRWVWHGEKINGRLFGKSGLYIKEKGKEKPRLLFLHFLALLGFSKSTRYHLDDFFFLLFSNVDLSYCWCNRAATILSLNPNNFSPTHSFSDYISNAHFHNKCVQFALCSTNWLWLTSLLFLQSSLLFFFPPDLFCIEISRECVHTIERDSLFLSFFSWFLLHGSWCSIEQESLDFLFFIVGFHLNWEVVGALWSVKNLWRVFEVQWFGLWKNLKNGYKWGSCGGCRASTTAWFVPTPTLWQGLRESSKSCFRFEWTFSYWRGESWHQPSSHDWRQGFTHRKPWLRVSSCSKS